MKQAQPLRALVRAVALTAAVLVTAPVLAQTAPIVFASWGGTTQSAQQKEWAQPFTQSSGIQVLMDGPTDYGKLKAMVDSGNVQWDVVDVEGDFAYAALRDGLVEPIDYSVVNKSQLDPRFMSPGAVGSFYYSFVLGYNKAAFKNGSPSTYADLFDTKRFPGKRTFYKWSAPGVLEVALLADGVAPDKLYPLDLDRAFKKLDTIKSSIVWWEAGAQAPQLLADGAVVMTQAYNGRIDDAVHKDKKPFKIVWDAQVYDYEWWAVVNGAKHADAAQKFIVSASTPQAYADLSKYIAYAPPRKDAIPLIDKARLNDLPTAPENFKRPLQINATFWADNADAINKRFQNWLTQ